MIVAPAPSQEAQRLAALRAYGILDTPLEAAFDAVTQLAADICRVPIALISLIDHERQWFKSAHGLPGVRETPRDTAFCAHAILAPELMEVGDARTDPRFHDNPLVVDNPGIRFYAGMPLVDSEQHALGTLCVIDRQPRTLTPDQRAALKQLSTIVLALFEHSHEQRQATQVLEFSEAQHRAIVESAPNAMLMTDRDGTVGMVNSQAETLFGYSREELMGCSVERLVPERFQAGHAFLRETFVTAPSTRPMGRGRDLYARRKNGSEVPVEIGINPIETADGLRILTAVVDISERKRAETLLAQQAAELEHINAELEQFAYVASHDLKAPLRGIANLSRWIEEDLDQKLDTDTRQNIELLRGRVKRMEALLDDLLAYSRAGRTEVKIECVDSSALVRDIIDLLQPPRGFSVIVSPEMPAFDTASAPLEQLFRNLIGNAIKHHDRVDGRIEVSARDCGEWYEFTVADDGPGVAPAYQQKIFHLFQTLKPRDQLEGTGMGLAICKKLVEQQGHRLSVESPLEKRGSAFRFGWNKCWQPKGSAHG